MPPSGGGGGPTPQAATYSGSETIANTYDGYPCGAPCGDPNVTPYPNNSVTYGINDKLTESNGSGTIITSETVTEPNETLTASLTALVTPSPNGGVTAETETKTVYTDSDGYTQSITYPTPLVVDEEPESNGLNWTNTASATTAESYNDGTNINRTTNSDGTYTETEVNNNTSIDDTATVNADASASWEAAPDAYGFLGDYFSGYTLTAPSGGDVTFTATYEGGGTESLSEPAFFSTTQPIIANNTSDSSTITTGVTFPVSCAVPATYGTSGNDIHTVKKSLDTLFGFAETTTTDAYTSSASGLVCVKSVDVLTTYYDWNLDEHYFVFVSDVPLIVTTTTTVLTLESGTGIGVASGSTGSATAASAGQAAVGAQDMVRAQTLRVRAQAVQRVLHVVLSHPAGRTSHE